MSWRQATHPFGAMNTDENPYDIVLADQGGNVIEDPAFTGLVVSGQVGLNTFLDGAVGSTYFYPVGFWEDNWVGNQGNWGGEGRFTKYS